MSVLVLETWFNQQFPSYYPKNEWAHNNTNDIKDK